MQQNVSFGDETQHPWGFWAHSQSLLVAALISLTWDSISLKSI